MMTKKIFFLILILGFTLRFYQLGQIPNGLNWDENSNAYNAYSILKTKKDEYGNFLPLSNRSFDDYKPPLYMYLTIPAVWFFDLTPLAARVVSALFGFLTLPVIYLLTKKLFGKESVALISMFFLAISPWHLQFSRIGFEANLGLFFITAAIAALLYGLTQTRWLVVSGFLIGFSAYSYHAERILMPVLGFLVLIVFRDKVLEIPKRYLLLFFLSAVLIILPLFIFTSGEAIGQRLRIASSESVRENIEQSISFIDQDSENQFKFGNLIHNRRVLIAQTFLVNYLSHFDFNFLFVRGDDNPRHHIGGMGMLYLFQLPLVVFGLYRLIKRHDRSSIAIMGWLLISPLAASPASPAPHAVRALTMVIAFQVITAYSLTTILQIFPKLTKVFLILIVGSFFVYLHNYYIHYPQEAASSWQYGYREAVLESEKLKNHYAAVFVDKSLEQAYIFWLFTTGYDPARFQQEGSRSHFDKYYFETKPPTLPNELFASIAENFPSGFSVIKTIYYPDGSEAVKIGYPR